VIIYRLPLGMSTATPRSHCPLCNYALRWYDNVPIVSYILLGGKCRNCKAHISLRYPAVELANTALWLLCAVLFRGKSVLFVCLCMAAISVWICVFAIDLRHMVIFDRFQLVLLAIGAAIVFLDGDFPPLSHIFGGIFGFLLFYLMSWRFEKLSGKEGLGGGDIKLAGTSGLLLGWERLILGLLIAAVSACIIMPIARKKIRNARGEFPFAPFLTAGFTVSMLFGATLIDRYLSLFGL